MLGTDISLKVTTNDETSLVICRHFADPPLDVSIAPVNWASNFFFLLLMTKTGPSPPYSTPLLTVV